MKNKILIFTLIQVFMLFVCSYSRAFCTDEDGDEIQRASWKTYFCCCLPPSREEKADHYFRKGLHLYENSFFIMDDAAKAMDKSALFGHPNAVAKAQEFRSYNPIEYFTKKAKMIQEAYTIFNTIDVDLEDFPEKRVRKRAQKENYNN